MSSTSAESAALDAGGDSETHLQGGLRQALQSTLQVGEQLARNYRLAIPPARAGGRLEEEAGQHAALHERLVPVLEALGDVEQRSELVRGELPDGDHPP